MKRDYVFAGAEILVVAYISGWLMFLNPLVQCAVAFNANKLTLLMVILSFCKVVLAAPVGMVIAWIIAILFRIWGEICPSDESSISKRNFR